MTEHATSGDNTKERLLEAAVELFARDGYYAVSVRQITKKADTHLSAVNYHFGDKRNLYFEVFRTFWYPRALQMRELLDEMINNGPVSPDVVIRRVAKSFVGAWASHELATSLHQIIAREMGQENEVADFIFENGPRMLFERLTVLLMPHMPPGTDIMQQCLNLFSLIGQLLHFSFGRRLISRWSDREYNEQFVDLVTEHIVQFTLKGMGIETQTENANAR